MSTNIEDLTRNTQDFLSLSLFNKNRLFTQLLATEEGKNLFPAHAKLVSLERNQVLYEQSDPIEFVYFPLDSIVSSLAIMEDGTTLETSMVGYEGLVGISAILGSGISRHWHWVSISGHALQLDARLLDRVFLQSEDALKALLQFYRSLMTQMSQRCVCNTRHTVLERLCCWLLMVHDRVGGGDLRLTQEMIASRLGARRAGITVAAGVLQAMHAIDYRRGQLHITDRDVLESAVCECYAIMRNEFRFTPPNGGPLIPVFHYK
jgi:CRP-like cAMP-binding protein